MIKQLEINGLKSYDDFGVYISSRKISQPKKKTIKESIPFSNVVYDFSNLNGEIYWEERTLEYTFDIAELSTEEMETLKSRLLDWLMNVHDTNIYDPYIGDYHFKGSFESDGWDEDFGGATLTVTFTVYPYKISNDDVSIIEEIGVSENGTLENSVNGYISELTINGISTQETTNGYSLANFNNGSGSTGVTATYENGTLKIIGDGSVQYQFYKVDITNIVVNNPSKELYFSFESINSSSDINGSIVQLNIGLTDGTNSYKHIVDKNKIQTGYTIPDDTSTIKSINISIYTTNSANETIANTIIVKQPMLQFGRNELEFEEYTGGVESPNPDYSSDIESLGDDGSIDISSLNANLVNFNLGANQTGVESTFENDILMIVGDGSVPYQSWSTNITDVVVSNPNKKIYFDFESFETIETLNGTVAQITVSYNNTTTKDYYSLYSKDGTRSKWTIPSDTTNITTVTFGLYSSNNATAMANTITITKPILQFGTDKLNYVQYEKNDVSITLSEPLRSLSTDVCDIYENGVITRRIGEITFDGSEVWTKNNGWETNGISCFYCTLTDRESRSYAICDKFVTKSFVDSFVNGYIALECLRYDSQAIYIFIKTDRLESDDVDGFISWLSKNNVTALYKLATPTTETIEFPNIPIYEDVTNIIIDDDVQPTFTVKYNEPITLNINNESSHRISPKIISTGAFTITLNNVSYAIGEGTYNNSSFYLEKGNNELDIIGYGELTFEYGNEVF